MSPMPGFEQLARSLDEDERKSLQRRIRESLSLSDDNGSSSYAAELQSTERKRLIEREMGRLGFWDRLVFWFRRLTSTKTDDVVFLKMKLDRMGSRIQNRVGGYLDLESRVISAEGATRIYSLYRNAYPVIPAFIGIWKNVSRFQGMVEYLLRQRIPESKTDLHDFMTMKDIQDVFLEKESRAEIRRELLSRLDAYIEGIHPDVFKHLEDGIWPLYYMRDIGLFSYSDLFVLFRVDIGLAPPGEEPPKFSSASFATVMESLEQLYFALYNAKRSGSKFELHDELIRYYLYSVTVNHDEREEPDSYKEIEDGVEAISLDAVKQFKDSLHQLADAAIKLDQDFPFVELIKWYHEDPYYRFLVYLPKLNLKAFYHAALKIRVLGRLDKRFQDVRLGVVGRMIDRIFRQDPPDFEHYRSTIHASIQKLGLPTFKYMKSLNILYNFIVRRYRGGLQEFVRVLNRITPIRLRSGGRDLLLVSAGLEDIAEKIEKFDQSFAPDADEGKAFFRVRYAVEKDLAQQRAYRAMVLQRDKEARTLIDKGLELLEEVLAALQMLQRNQSPSMAEKYRQFAAPGSSLELELKKHTEELEMLRKLITQLVAIEEGH
ncbi:MAG: hypothetical protein EA428_03105 [Spirochaetaceae bacterium]|nr:MAG: hypothetical protein EA428_03105 [Spirochaetaceae bacterium]